MKLRFARPALLVDIGRLDELSYVRDDGDTIAIGALTRHHDVATDALAATSTARLLAATAAQIGDPQVRHRGTIGGSVAHGDPASDLPTCLLALDAEIARRSAPGSERTSPAATSSPGVFETALGPQDVLTEIRVRKLGGAGTTYVKFNRRRAGLGDGRRRRGGSRTAARDRAHEHGPDAAPGPDGRGGAGRGRGRGRGRRRGRDLAADGRAGAPSTASISPGC